MMVFNRAITVFSQVMTVFSRVTPPLLQWERTDNRSTSCRPSTYRCSAPRAMSSIPLPSSFSSLTISTSMRSTLADCHITEATMWYVDRVSTYNIMHSCTHIYVLIILLKSVCRCSQSTCRSSCSIISGDISNCSFRLSFLSLTCSHPNSARHIFCTR